VGSKPELRKKKKAKGGEGRVTGLSCRNDSRCRGKKGGKGKIPKDRVAPCIGRGGKRKTKNPKKTKKIASLERLRGCGKRGGKGCSFRPSRLF